MGRISEARKQYEKEYRQMKREQNRVLEATKPGRILRNNPDYALIVKAIEEEKRGGNV